MKRLILLLYLLISLNPAYCEKVVFQNIRQDIDSIFQKIEIEKDENKRFSLVLSSYHIIIDSNPLLIIESAQKLYDISQKNKDEITEACAWIFYGQGFRLSANYIKALECQHKAITIAERIKNKSVLAFVQNQLANIYKDREEYEKSFRLYQESKVNALKGVDKEILPWPYMHFGEIYLINNQPDSALYYSQLAYDILTEKNITVYSSFILNNMANAYSKMGDINMAIQYYAIAIKKAQERNSARFLNLSYLGLAEHFQRFNQQDSSVFYAKKAIDVVQNTLFYYLSIAPSKLLTDIYENSNADSTLKYLKIYRSANDSLYNTRENLQLQMMTIEEEQRQKQLAIERIDYKYKIRMMLLIAGLTFFLLIAFILYRNNRQKQKANKQLQEQKQEIQTTLEQLKSTQSQLIQSEKMASLGELTAGIAHEIQNPLNFVNNFSEVSTELLEELEEEIENGNLDEVKAITSDLFQNLEKINNHGQRASSIVKGMLLHSRGSSGQKELTDINALCDEYLRLSYHGFRAKDKSFNADFRLEADESLPKINVIPQDIGRVFLNLINNAFYVVNEKAKQNIERYKPEVIVKTSLIPPSGGGGASISVSDNGPGIPAAIVDKIFQPFFTTKPTGSGTGLGLSLSYDIVKAHGGELKVKTIEGEGSTFIMQLPII